MTESFYRVQMSMLFVSFSLTAEMERSNRLVSCPDKIPQLLRSYIRAARRQRDDFRSKPKDANRQGTQDVGEISSISCVHHGQDRFFFRKHTKQLLGYVDKLQRYDSN